MHNESVMSMLLSGVDICPEVEMSKQMIGLECLVVKVFYYQKYRAKMC